MGDSTKKRKKPSETEVLVANDETVSADASTSLTEVVKTKNNKTEDKKKRKSSTEVIVFDNETTSADAPSSSEMITTNDIKIIPKKQSKSGEEG